MLTLVSTRFRLWLAVLIYGGLVATLAVMFYQNTFRSTLGTLQDSGAVRLGEAASRLRLQIDGYRALANVIANDPQMAEALRRRAYAAAAKALADYEATYGAWRVDLLTADGTVLASSTPTSPDPTFPAALLDAATNNRLGFARGLDGDDRTIRLSRGVRLDDVTPAGVVVVTVSLSALEFEWPVSPEPIAFFDTDAVAFSSNRPELLLLSRAEGPAPGALDLARTAQHGPHQLWRFTPPSAPSYEIIKTEQFVPHLDLTGAIFLDTTDARAAAQQSAILVMAGGLVLGLIGTIALQQRRRRVLEEQYSAELEARVEARTQELRGAQDALVEASKLAALGRLSAGVSHELNQPLAAILNFAENGQKFLARGRPEPATQNLTLISDQVRRITRIIGNLRAFARQEVAPTDLVNFGQVVRAAVDMARDDIDASGADLNIHVPDHPLWVLAGRVRLEQVVLNLIANALDAMADTDPKHVAVALVPVGATAVLTVRDTGHGIADPSRVFEPFYTTKDLGDSKGLGMGLALSFGIISRFGGTLSCRNLGTQTAPSGAEFKVSLPLTETEDA